MAPLDNPAIPKGSLVLVTGVNGLLGSHVAKQFLEYGYKVRGTVRDVEKNAWLTAAFDKQYGQGNFELVAVADLTDEKAVTEAAKGASVVAHTASIMSLDPDPNNVIPGAIGFAVAAIKAAYAEPSVKRFVFTSSSAAAVNSNPDGTGVTVTEESWNEAAVEKAWADPPYTPERRGPVYAASKVQAEQAIWKYHKEHRSEKPDFVVNTVLPNFNWGRSIDPVNQGYPSSSHLPVLLFKGQVTPFHAVIKPQYYIDVDDTGRLHVAAAIFDHVKDQRIFGLAGRFNWDAILDILRKNFPNKTFPENFSGGEDPNEIEPRDKAEQLLKDLGRPGWTSLEESVLANVEDVAKEEDPKL
ncbi:Aldehyde reductase 2 [Fusarium oxysporum f. sp. rapae]|uniref:Aldehyde reductase 2 n=1 Tax=Fusarium oxysporum f. sp. rapae TaxID=485398 RepID=A0A8J5U5N4_FUSOX|nr:Aldehyde reductase 2 [Fusarium oxysporum f. sp. rapae]